MKSSYQGYLKRKVSTLAEMFDQRTRNTFETNEAMIRGTIILLVEDIGELMPAEAQPICIIDVFLTTVVMGPNLMK